MVHENGRPGNGDQDDDAPQADDTNKGETTEATQPAESDSDNKDEGNED